MPSRLQKFRSRLYQCPFADSKVVQGSAATLNGFKVQTELQVPLAVVGVGGAAVAAIVLMRGGHSYETHDYDSAAESGLPSGILIKKLE